LANQATGSHFVQIFTSQEEAHTWATKEKEKIQKGSKSRPIPVETLTSPSEESEASETVRPRKTKKSNKSSCQPPKAPRHHHHFKEPVPHTGGSKKAKGQRAQSSNRKSRLQDHGSSDNESSIFRSSDNPSEGSDSEDTSSDSDTSTSEDSLSSSSSSFSDDSVAKRRHRQRRRRVKKKQLKKSLRKQKRHPKMRCPTVPDTFDDDDTSVGDSQNIHRMLINGGKIDRKVAPDLMRPWDYKELCNSAVDVTPLPGGWAPKYKMEDVIEELQCQADQTVMIVAQTAGRRHGGITFDTMF
jgi:hypothetical protein